MNNDEHRLFVQVATALPLAATVLAIGLAVTGKATVLDILLFLAMYTITVFGVTVGYHRLLAHRSFSAPGWARIALTVAGGMAAQGPSIVWVAHHRRHHRLTDREGDPHSPYVDAQGRELSAWRGFWHAHMGWLLDPELSSDHVRYCPDLVRDRSQRWLSLHFQGLVAAGVVLPGLVGLVVTRSLVGFLTGMLWGGLVRMFVVNQITYAINSAGHVIGRRGFATPDESRNLGWLALASFGESWHNNHHSVPRSADFGLHWWQLDLGGAFVRLLEALGVAHDVVRFDRGTLERRAARLSQSGGGRRAQAEPPPPMAAARAGNTSDARLMSPADVD